MELSHTKFTELMIMLVIVILLGIVMAQPSLPHQFFGGVVCTNGNPVPDGIVIDFKYSNTLLRSVQSSNGQYGYSPLLLIWDLNDNDPVDIYANSQLITQVNYVSGDLSNINIIVPDSLCSTSTPPSSGGGGGSGGGGSGGSFSGAGSGLSSVSNTIEDSLNKIKDSNTTNITNTQNTPLNLIEKLSPTKVDRFVALNISLISLIVMAFITLFSIRRLNKSNQKVYK